MRVRLALKLNIFEIVTVSLNVVTVKVFVFTAV